MSLMLGILARLRGLFGREPAVLNLHVEPAYAIKASGTNPYFEVLEEKAREAGFLGEFVVDREGWLRPGASASLETKHATLALDVYPNPAVIEGRTVADYEVPDGPRRQPRATLVLDDESELFLWREGGRLRVTGDAVSRAQ